MDNAAKESNYYADIDRAESRSLSFNQLCDRARDEMLWYQLEEAMATAPAAQRKAFWHELLALIDVEARLISKQNVSMIAAPLQEAVALAIDEKVSREIDAKDKADQW